MRLEELLHFIEHGKRMSTSWQPVDVSAIRRGVAAAHAVRL